METFTTKTHLVKKLSEDKFLKIPLELVETTNCPLKLTLTHIEEHPFGRIGVYENEKGIILDQFVFEGQTPKETVCIDKY